VPWHLSLGKKPWAGAHRGAARRGNDIGATTYGSIKSILRTDSFAPSPNEHGRENRRSGTPTIAGVATTTEQLRDDRVPREAASGGREEKLRVKKTKTGI